MAVRAVAVQESAAAMRAGEMRPRGVEGASSEGWALACAPSHAEARSASGDPSSSLAHACTVRRPLLATPCQGGHAKHGQSSCACWPACGVERTELALVQRRGTTADKLALLPHEPIRAGWTKSTARNKMRLLIRRQQAGAAEEPVEGDIRHRCVGPIGVGRSRDSCPRVAEGERGPTDVCDELGLLSRLRSERGG